MKEKCTELLNCLGLADTGNDPLLNFILQSVTDSILNKINQEQIPDGLTMAAVYQVVGQYLKIKKDSGQLEGFDLDGAIKQIQEGDTSITYAIGDGDFSPEQRLENLISWLSSYGDSQIYRYRRLVW